MAQEEPAASFAAASNDNPQVSAEQTLTQVRALHAAGRFAAALEPLAQYLASDSRNTVVCLEYARTLAILRRFPEAAREYRRVLETEPQNPAALIGVAKVASWQGQNQLALETYDRVLVRHPSLYDALVGKGFVLLWMGRQEEARSLFHQAQRQYPKDPEVREALASLGLPTPFPIRAGAAGETAKTAAEAPKTSEALKAAEGQALPQPAAIVAPPALVEEPLQAAAVGIRLTREGPAQAVPQKPEKGSVPSPVTGTGERAGVASRVVSRHEARPAPAGAPTVAPQATPKPAPTPAIPLAPARSAVPMVLQLATLGILLAVAVVAYRTRRAWRFWEPLPAGRVLELPPSTLPAAQRPAAAGVKRDGPLAGRVLVVHPEEAVRDFARKVLGGAGAEVLALARGEDAMVRLEKSPYDAIVVSDQLPAGWNGREIYRWLERNQPGAERRFVLALTDMADPEMQSFLEETRALAISAPFGVSDLLAMTRLAMGRSRAGVTQA